MTDYITAFFLGLVGSSHCIVMCGGLMGAISHQSRRFIYIVEFNLFRVMSYGLLALALSSLLMTVKSSYFDLLFWIRSAAAVMLILMGLYIANIWKILSRVETIGQPIWRLVSPITRKMLPIQHHYQAMTVGILWVFLPCGLIYSSLVWAASQGDIEKSVMLMIVFGLGTLPSTLLIGKASQQMAKFSANQYLRISAGLLITLSGAWQAYNLWY